MDFKYRDALYLRRQLGGILYDKYLYEMKHLRDIRVLTYIPLSPIRRIQRGYNQSRELACELSKRSGIPVFPLLKRIKNTKRLKNLGKEERFLELRDSMKVKDKYLTIIRENKILIIDDIFTTGATINEAARCLMNAGAESVKSLTVATR
ncbi:MAG: phosphoribosyltransferase family protein [Bacillota bacterium]|nr:phosphoribosyltransferase family protein [Bacillota bacterium]